jgi:hypothetical protein
VTDNDGLAGTNSTNIRVDNVPPTLTNFATTNLGSNGVLTISGKVTDPGKADVITLTINWENSTQTYTMAPGQETFQISHKYSAPPDPSNPSAPITIKITVADDDLGAVNSQKVADTPGLGAAGDLAFFYVQQDPNVPRFDTGGGHVDYAEAQPIVLAFTTVQFDSHMQQGDAFAAAKPVVALRTFDPVSGVEQGVVLLPVDVLNNLSALFVKLPDDHYRLYYVEQGTERLIMDVVVRHGKPIDPTDDSEGTQDRPPTAQFDRAERPQELIKGAAPADAQEPLATGEEDEAPPAEAEESSDVSLLPTGPARFELPVSLPPAEVPGVVAFERISGAKYRAMLAPAVAAVAASSVWAGGRWAQEVDTELANAPADSLSKSARLRRRLWRMLEGDKNSNRLP